MGREKETGQDAGTTRSAGSGAALTQPSQVRDANAQINGGHHDAANNNTAKGDSTTSNGHVDSKAAAKQTQSNQSSHKLTRAQLKEKMKSNPSGGYDSTPVADAMSGFTIEITIHRAENLPVSDLTAMSTDPFVTVELSSALPRRHKEDPDMVLRTRTMHKTTNPVWDAKWTVAGVPASGCRIKCRLYDEDPSDHDDRLGNVTIFIRPMGIDYEGISERKYDIKKRMASKRAYLLRGCVSMVDRSVHMGAYLYVSVRCLGESEKPWGRMFTLGDTYWFKHFSPMIGRLAGTKAPEGQGHTGDGQRKGQVEKYDFQANQMQLQGPVPAELYHRFVEFKPFVKGMFSKAGIRGRILNKTLHHQHARVYNFSPSTKYGIVEPCSQHSALQFLRLVHFDEGGRIFTYVLTLDGLLRFTETGKEFGIDLLSKHTMHSDVNIYIACSGEFFIRRLKRPNKPADSPDQETHPATDLPGGPPHTRPPQQVESYELVIDNDSGTYRPKGDLLPLLKDFLSKNFPGLQVVTGECTDDKLQKMKQEQRERKKSEGNVMQVVQGSDSDSISSSDEEALDAHADHSKISKRSRAYRMLENPAGKIPEKAGKEHEAHGKSKGMSGRKQREQMEEMDDQVAAGNGMDSGVERTSA